MLRSLVLAAVLLGVIVTVADANIQIVGGEATLGPNGTGEACRLRFVLDEASGRAFQSYYLYCDGWTVASGTLFRFRAARDTTPERLLTESGFQKGFETRLAACTPAEATTLADGTASALRQCTRRQGGWPVVVMAAVGAGRAYTIETFPTNARVMEHAVAVLQGKAQPGATREGTLSPAIRRAETMVGATGKLIGVQEIGAVETLWRLGRLQYRSGSWGTAEATFRRQLEIQERVLGVGKPGTAAILNELGLAIGRQGSDRFDEADRFFARAEKAAQAALADEPMINFAYRASVYRDAKPVEALAWAEQAMTVAKRYSETSANRAYTTGLYGVVLTNNKRYADAEVAAREAIRICGLPGGDAEFRVWWEGEMHAQLGRIVREQKRFADARREYELGHARTVMLFGDASPRAIENLGQLGFNELEAGDLEAALGHYRKAAALQIQHRAALEGARPPTVLAYLDTLARAAAQRPAERPALAAEALTAIQIPRGSETAKALRAMSARVGSGDPKLATYAREYQDLTRRRASVRAQLAAEMIKPADQRERHAELTQQLREAEEAIEANENRLQAEYPRYAALSAERPLPADDIRALLQPDEALIAFMPGVRTTFLVVARRERAHFFRAAIGSAKLDEEIKALRANLDLSTGGNTKFDVARAKALYDALLAPAAPALTGVRHLLAVPTGALMSFPLGVLVTKDPPPGGDARTVPFLAADMAISVLPSVAALRDLRAVASKSPAPQPFLAFADPQFSGSQGDRRAVGTAANLCREAGGVDPALLTALPRLPESAEEVKRIGAALGAGPDALVLGAAATERRVRDTDLSRYRVVAFATHGLLPGELRCLSEPALALTPPAAGTKGEDGLLDASEVATLKLDADWVILSACNTAGPDGSLGGESLSGLTRAFFYAGARALLVSHWTVASGPTVELTTGTLAAMAQDAKIGKAEALRRAQAKLRARAETAHPFFWAPFVLVGDGGAIRP